MIIIEDANKKRFEVLEGVQLTAEARQDLGMVDPVQVIGSTVEKSTADLDEKLGFKLGDLIAGVIKSTKLDKLLGKVGCSPCEKRRVILNMASQIGVKETARQLLETLKEDNGPR